MPILCLIEYRQISNFSKGRLTVIQRLCQPLVLLVLLCRPLVAQPISEPPHEGLVEDGHIIAAWPGADWVGEKRTNLVTPATVPAHIMGGEKVMPLLQ